MGIFVVIISVFILLFSVAILRFALVPKHLEEEEDSNNNQPRNVSLDGGDIRVDISQAKQILHHPRAFIYQGFLSDEECDHLIGLAKDNLKRSTVITNDNFEMSVIGQERTSSDAFLETNQDEVVSRIERRIATWTFLPEENGEAIQVLRYEKDEKFDPHYDSYNDNTTSSGHRMATLIMYLSDVQKGGETVFPLAKENEKEGDTWSDCAKKGYAVKPKRGDALLFFNLHPNSTEDMDSLHGGCPVIQGVKWSATKWLHENSFGIVQKPSACADQNKDCPIWAEAGECQKNPKYMLGTKFSVGNCLKSCNAC